MLPNKWLVMFDRRALILIILVYLFHICVSYAIKPFRTSGSWHSRRTNTDKSIGASVKHNVIIQQDSVEHKISISENESILEAALEAGIELPHDCKLGVCLTCPGRVVSGKVDQSGTTLDDSVVNQGYALMCMTFPRSDMVIRCIDEDELVNVQFSGRM